MATNRAANRSAKTHPQQPVSNLKSWWSDLVGTVSLDPEYRNQIITYTTWNIWKERCRRVYDNKDDGNTADGLDTAGSGGVQASHGDAGHLAARKTFIVLYSSFLFPFHFFLSWLFFQTL
jgi:hypothetical protein